MLTLSLCLPLMQQYGNDKRLKLRFVHWRFTGVCHWELMNAEGISSLERTKLTRQAKIALENRVEHVFYVDGSDEGSNCWSLRCCDQYGGPLIFSRRRRKNFGAIEKLGYALARIRQLSS